MNGCPEPPINPPDVYEPLTFIECPGCDRALEVGAEIPACGGPCPYC